MTDIPLEQESGRKHLPILMCLLVFLLIIVLGAGTSISGVLKKWQNSNDQKIIIEITQDINVPIDIERVKKILPTIPGISSFEIVKDDKIILLLKPIGETDTLKDLKSPIVINVDLDPKSTFNITEAQRLLSTVAPNSRIESHAKWHQTLISLTNSLYIIVYNLIGFILIAIFTIVSLMTRASLNVHRSTIDVLRLMGARKQYIASYFQNSSFYLCLKGSFMGLLIAIPTLIFIEWVSKGLGIPKLFGASTEIWLWIFLTSIPFTISFFAMFVSRLAVIGTLIRMDA
ncbi:MAG: hypothetical protein Q8S21_01835 [Candidatus Paracaedibacteraceae bacterium]|nr:hypothetical protein [Candidatus Paracaedibacteraceae bacterium]